MKQLKKERLHLLNYGGGSGVLMGMVGSVLSRFLHEDNEKNYIQCGYLIRRELNSNCVYCILIYIV